MQVLLIEGATNIYWSSDLYFPFSSCLPVWIVHLPRRCCSLGL